MKCAVFVLPYHYACYQGLPDVRSSDVTPFEFLDLVRNAEVVLTDSFHGVAFAVAFNVQFFVFDRQYAHSFKESSRIESILDVLGLKSRHVQSLARDSRDGALTIDYRECNAKLESERNESVSYLLSSLNCVQGKGKDLNVETSSIQMPRIRKLAGVVDWRLCHGCGACAYICPEQRVRLVDFFAEGIRPVVEAHDCGGCRECLEVCPSVQSDFRSAGPLPASNPIDRFAKGWGPVVAIWEGHATDPEIRFKGASGGVLTAISAYCVEVLGMHGVLHIAQDPEDPIRNRTRLSRTREELLAATGSRYSPASVCNGLGLVEAAPAPCVVIGQPSEIAAVRNARKMRPDLDRNVGVTLSFFCAGTPSTQGTAALLREVGVDPCVVARPPLSWSRLAGAVRCAETRRIDTKPEALP